MLTCNSTESTFDGAAILIGSQRDSFAAVAHCPVETSLRGATVEIPLTHGKVTIIDDEDWPLVSQYTWSAFSSSGKRKPHWYATATTPRREGRKAIRLHRILLNAPKGIQVDHRDSDGLNNRRANLRLCTHGQNQQNRKAVVSKSGYKGVSRVHKKPHWNVRWIAAIKKDGRCRHLGSFDTAEAAARAYDRAATQLFGEFASLNFPQEDAQAAASIIEAELKESTLPE